MSATEVEALAVPFQYDQDSELPEEYHAALHKLFYAHGECMMPYFGLEAVGRDFMFESQDVTFMSIAVNAESRLRASNFRNEEFKHQYLFYRLYHEFDPELPQKIYENEVEQFRVVDKKFHLDDWTDRALYNTILDRFGVYQGFEWVESSYSPMARVALSVCKDERGHSNMGTIHLREAIQDPEQKKFAQERLHEFWMPKALDAFGREESENNALWRAWGLKKHDNETLRRAYYAEVRDLMRTLGLEVPPYEHNRHIF